jgi:ferredoxin
MGEAGAAFIDPAALSRTLGDWRGAAAMPRERRDRIDRVLLVLRRFLSEASAPISVVAAHDLLPELSGLDEGIEVLQHPDPLSAAALRFDEMSAGLAEVFAAMHVARMELLGQYDPDRHDPWLEGYGWRSFSREERRLLPAVIAVESADRMSGTALPALSRTILSGRPLHILVDVRPAASSAEEDPRSGSRLELGYLAIGHRDAFVHQSTPARPDHLLDGFDRALAASRPALHLLAVGSGAAGAPPVIGDWLQVGAAIEARAHPLFIYDPEAGATWARRLDFGGNPAVDQDWPATELSVVDASGETRTTEIAFTFADLALLEPDRRDAFRVVPEVTGLDDHDDLVPVDRYLAADPVDAVHQIPFVWGVDAGGELRRLAVAGSLVAACRDRLDFWRTLQELAGVRNAYVTEATERVRSEMAEALAAERARLAEARDNAVAEAEERAAGDAMEALSRMLLDLDLDGAPPVARAPSRAGAPRVASSTASPPSLAEDAATSSSDIATSSSDDGAPQAAASSAVEDDDGGFDDPWIDTPRCTSCNDCMTVNALTFVYDENKQARIGDASAATFEHLVRAAELCPAKCIHPGKPQNPDEPNLDELIRRAARFNA